MRRALLLALLLGNSSLSRTTAPAAALATALPATALPAQTKKEAANAQTVPGEVTLKPEKPLVPGVVAALRGLPAGVKYAVLVRNASDGKVLESSNADLPLIPASSLKTVTGAAVLLSRQGARGWWSTELTVPATEVGKASVTSLTLRGSADPLLTVSDGPDSLRELARQAYAHGVRQVRQLRLDETRLNGATFMKTDYAAPMLAVRLRDWDTLPPPSVEVARQLLGAALAAELGRAGIRVASPALQPAPAYVRYKPPVVKDKDGKVLPPARLIPPGRRPEQAVASVRGTGVVPYVWSTLRPSNNAQAESLLATLAVRPGGDGTLKGAAAHELKLLRKLGVNVTGLRLTDGSGLGRENRLTPRALTDLMKVMYDLPYPLGKSGLPDQLYHDHQNAFVEALPLAGTGENLPEHGGRGGTMALRLVGSGLDVRAKTGTLPGVSSLAGYERAKSGRLLTFAIIMNGPETVDLLALRAVQDRMVRAMAAAH
ncbi:D-alanyl-D-alanine carboxypeptidase [Deinococcus sp.]|uniref:D-alanyl-D-alanine carboxypeptidase n=1 Tax=Deinococcus sp. TaxID=47478 RepID=UPI0025BCE454|nr:D-alanyl-D-alanine carboxypeptidase [Deinococcus sp.]